MTVKRVIESTAVAMALGGLTLSAAAIASCCVPQGTWGVNDGDRVACAGTYAFVCDDATGYALHGFGYGDIVVAQCYSVTLSREDFLHAPCDRTFDGYSKFPIPLPGDGTSCCFFPGSSLNIMKTPQNFKILMCTSDLCNQ